MRSLLKPGVLGLFLYLYAFILGQALTNLNIPLIAFSLSLVALTFCCQTQIERMEAHRGAEVEWAD